MKTIGLFEAKTHFSALADEVAEKGQAILVTRRGKPLVRIEAVPTGKDNIISRVREYWEKYGKEPGEEQLDFEIPPRDKEMPRKVTFD